MTLSALNPWLLVALCIVGGCALGVLICVVCQRAVRWHTKRWAKQTIDEFRELLPGKCPVCAFHRWGIEHGFEVAGSKAGPHSNCTPSSVQPSGDVTYRVWSLEGDAVASAWSCHAPSDDPGANGEEIKMHDERPEADERVADIADAASKEAIEAYREAHEGGAAPK